MLSLTGIIDSESSNIFTLRWKKLWKSSLLTTTYESNNNIDKIYGKVCISSRKRAFDGPKCGGQHPFFITDLERSNSKQNTPNNNNE